MNTYKLYNHLIICGFVITHFMRRAGVPCIPRYYQMGSLINLQNTEMMLEGPLSDTEALINSNICNQCPK